MNPGDKFNHLTAVEYLYTHKSHSYWIFQCDCGKLKVMQSDNIKYGHTKSCGCLKSKRMVSLIKSYIEEKSKYVESNNYIHNMVEDIFEFSINTQIDKIKYIKDSTYSDD